MEIEIIGKNLQQVKEALESAPGFNASDALLEMRERKTKYRSLSPTSLVANVGATGSGLGALVSGLSHIRQQVAAKKIVLETHDGNKMEVPANTSSDQIDLMLDKLGPTSGVRKISVE